VRRGRYYLGRVVKLGELDQERLVYAIREPKVIDVGQFQWTFTDTVDTTSSEDGFIFSRLSKYSQEGHVTIVDTTTKSRRDSVAENLLIASAPFIYLPEFSGIAYLHVWNGIEESVFRRRFSALIEETYDNFFVSCEIDPISDYRAFVTKLKTLDSFSEIRAKVHPPNPLFGDLWKDLNEYIKSRNASEVQIAEKSDKKDGLSTDLVNLINAIVEERISEIANPASLTDAALLMAADGYGSGKVIGVHHSETVIIRTSDTQKSFLFDKEPLVDEIAAETRRRFKVISQERDMRH
jgi:hypothetical protein